MVFHWSQWQEVSGGLQDSTQYSSLSQQCISLYGLNFSSDFKFRHFLFEALGERSKCANYNWYHRHPHGLQLFSPLARLKYLVNCLLSFFFTLRSIRTTKSLEYWASFGGVFFGGLDDPFVSQNYRKFYESHFRGQIRFVRISFVCIIIFESLAQVPVDLLSQPVVYEKTGLLSYPGASTKFQLILTVLWSWHSQLFFSRVSLLSFLGLFHRLQLWLVFQPFSYSITFFSTLWQGLSIHLVFSFPLLKLCDLL